MMYIVHLGGIVPIHTIYFEYETESDSVKHICMRHSFTLEPQHSAVRDGNELITVFVRRGISRDRSRSPLKTSPDIVSHVPITTTIIRTIFHTPRYICYN